MDDARAGRFDRRFELVATVLLVHAMGGRLPQALSPRVPAGVRSMGRDQAAHEHQCPAIAVRHAPVQATAQADRLEAQAAGFSEQVGGFIQRADNYSLTVVLFAASLFFAGISTRLRSPTPRMIVLGLGYALFLSGLIWIATFPISVSV